MRFIIKVKVKLGIQCVQYFKIRQCEIISESLMNLSICAPEGISLLDHLGYVCQSPVLKKVVGTFDNTLLS